MRKIAMDLIGQLARELTERHKIEAVLRELLDAMNNRKSERLSEEQLDLFEAAGRKLQPDADSSGDGDDDGPDDTAGIGN